MHRKTSTTLEKLTALPAVVVLLALALATRLTTVATSVRSSAAARALAQARAASWMRARLKGRAVAVGLVTAPALALAFITGTAVVVTTTDREPHVAAMDVQDRATLAMRADRADRGSDASAPADPVPAEAATTAAAPPPPPPAWVSPMRGIPLSSCYGPRWGRMHKGIDFAGEEGTPIISIGEGTVFGVGWLYAGYGISVVIDHGNGIFTHYAHLSKTNVIAGQRVVADQTIGWEGTTGDSTGPHLHFEVHAGLWNQIDPAEFLREHGVMFAC
jgi:murein DD-endopeptidase MepM/ murein hydrolase activator NlpD